MFSQRIVESDAFYSLSFAAQALYMHLNMFADDDGVVHNPNKVIRSLCISENDWVGQLTELKNSFDRLIEKRFLLDLGNGIVVIKHWRMNNTIRKDRYNPSQYQEELSRLIIKDNGSYTEKDGDGVVTSWLPRGYEAVTDVATQYSIVENSIVESSVGKERVGVQGEREPIPSHPETKNVDKSVENLMLGIHGNVQLSQKELAKLKLAYPDNWERMVDDLSAFIHSSGKHYDRHYDIITGWAGGAV
jgi:hypothetical protein